MPRTEEENQRIREEQKKNILQAAMRVFARKGFAATRMADIAVEANVSYGLAYHYFPNKEQILTALLEEALARSARVSQQALEMPGTPWERLHWFVSTRLAALQEHPEFIMALHRVMMDEGAYEKWREVARRQGDLPTKMMRTLIVEGQKSGEIIQNDPDQLVMALRSCLLGLTFSAIYHDCAQSFPDVEIILRLLKP